MPLPRQALLLFEILGEAAGRPMQADEIAAKLYGAAERPASYVEAISRTARDLRAVLAELGLAVSCRQGAFWLSDLDHKVAVSGPPRKAPRALGVDWHNRAAVRGTATLAARRFRTVEPRVER